MIIKRGVAMVTKFGQFCRELRAENGELLYDMATKLNVSSSFLSMVEKGKKKPPVDWEQMIIIMYRLNGESLERFKEAFFEAVNYESIDVSSMSAGDKELMLSFARNFDSIDKDSIRKLLSNIRKDG